jgi:hypothetical protein
MIFTPRAPRLLARIAPCVALFRLAPVAPAQPSPAPALAAIATRVRVETGDNVAIGGFVITGNAPKKVMVRAVGPSLTSFGVAGALPDPTLELFSGQTAIAANDNWREAPEAAEIAATHPLGSDLEAALIRTLNPGSYTAILRGKNNTTGVGLVEVYDLNPGSDSRLAGIATRGLVQTGDNVMISGVVVTGAAGSSQRVLIRATGPSLPFGGTLSNPTLQLFDAGGALIRSNDNWRINQLREIQSTGQAPTNDAEAAIVATLPPGAYTAVVGGASATTGVGLAEVFLDHSPAPGAWGFRAPLLEANSELAAAEVNGKIYLLGGYPMNRVTARTVQVYDIASDRWVFGPQLPVPNNHGMAASLNGKLYLIGGQTQADDPPGGNSYVNTVYELDPATNAWVAKASMPTARSSGVAVVHEGKIYVAGGRPPRERDFAVYDPVSDTWEVLPEMPTPRNHFTGAAINGRIHYVGGRQGLGLGNAMTTAHEVFDPQTRTWSTAAPMLRARSGMNGIMARGLFHVWGGEGPAGMFHDHDIYDPRTNQWTHLGDMPLAVHGVYGAAFVDGLIWNPGGGTAVGGSSGSVFNQVYRPAMSAD